MEGGAVEPTDANASTRLALLATADAWRRSYNGEPATSGETAAALLFAANVEDAAEDRAAEFVGVRCG
jgi:hypothetical protein